jgi:hypothetical protein
MKTLRVLSAVLAAVILSGCRQPSSITTLGSVSQTYTNKITTTAGSSGPCPGSYQAKTSLLTNTVAPFTRWFVLPAGKTNFLCAYSGPTNNFPTVRVRRRHDFAVQCGITPFTWDTTVNTLAANQQFAFEMFFLGTNPPTTGDIAALVVSPMP